MADTPETTPTDAAATPSAAGGEGASPKPSGGLASYLPLIVVIVLMPIAAWVTLMVKSKLDKTASGESTEETAPSESKEASSHSAAAKSESSHEKGKTIRRTKKRKAEMPVALTREIVAFQPARDPDPTKPDDVDKIVVLDAKGEPKDVAQPDKIVVNVANASGRAYAVARLSLRGPAPTGNTDDFIEAININRERLLDVATGTLSSKTLDEIEKPGFRNVLRSELLALFNQVLGGNAVSDVVITEFITQQ